ncbi:MAG: helical backbone metal receptor [Clostridia bacterium]|nr:helical backbone metal receptor [Clostridia bacterium]
MKRSIAKKVASGVLSMCMLLSVVTACSDSANETESTTAAATEETEATTTEAQTEATEETEAQVVDGNYPVVLTDIYGHEVSIESEPQTIVSISPALTEIIYELGQGSKLIGRTDYDDYPAEVFDVPSIGDLYTPNIEAIVELDPDVILASSIFTEDAYNQLTDLGYTVVIIMDETTLSGMFENINNVAAVLNCADVAESYCEELQDRLDAIVVPETDVTVYYCLGFGEWGEYTAGGDTFINDIIVAAGAKNAAADVSGWSYSIEALLEADPDYILVSAWDYDTFIATEPYNTLTAVQNGKVFAIDNNIFDRQCGRNVDAVELINGIILGQAEDVDVDEAA